MLVAKPSDPNAHIKPEDASILLADPLEEIRSKVGQEVRIAPLGKFKTVEDATTKLLVETTTGMPAAVIIFSRLVAPDLVARATQTAQEVRSLLGSPLADVVPEPIAHGYADGRSYEVLPCFRELPRRRLFRKLRWRLLQSPVLGWLERASAQCVKNLPQHQALENFSLELDHLRAQTFIDSEIRRAIDASIKRLESREWVPRHTLDHNDIWQGNVMLPRHSPFMPRSLPPFILIDWAGANLQGYGIFDVVRGALAFGLSPGSLASRLHQHAVGLGISLADTRGHLLASLGRLHRHIEHFPEDKYIATFDRCWRTLNRALDHADVAID